ncbi:MAG: antibiotic biosynthesis monooxygenase [Cyanobacteria bacterium P01_G01_bin.38]
MSNVVLLLQAIVKVEAIEAFKNEVISTASEATKELFCVSINLCQDPDQPSHFTLYEVWGDKEYLLSDAHRQSPHILAFFKNTESMLAQPFQYSILNSIHELKGTDLARQ